MSQDKQHNWGEMIQNADHTLESLVDVVVQLWIGYGDLNPLKRRQSASVILLWHLNTNHTIKTSLIKTITTWVPKDKGTATYFQAVHTPRRIPLGLSVDQCPNLVPHLQQADCERKI